MGCPGGCGNDAQTGVSPPGVSLLPVPGTAAPTDEPRQASPTIGVPPASKRPALTIPQSSVTGISVDVSVVGSALPATAGVCECDGESEDECSCPPEDVPCCCCCCDGPPGGEPDPDLEHMPIVIDDTVGTT